MIFQSLLIISYPLSHFQMKDHKPVFGPVSPLQKMEKQQQQKTKNRNKKNSKKKLGFKISLRRNEKNFTLRIKL